MSRVPARNPVPATQRTPNRVTIAPNPGGRSPIDVPQRGARHFVAILRRRWVLIAVSVVVAAIAGYLVSNAQTPRYQAEATLLVLTKPQDLLTDSGSAAASTSTGFDAAKGQGLASLDVVVDRASKALNGAVTPDQIRGNVSVVAESGASLVNVIAKDTDPQRAATVATTFSQTYIAFLKETDQASYQEAAALVRLQIENAVAAGRAETEITDLRSQLDRLRDAGAQQTGGLRLVQRAEAPGGPYSPHVGKATALGLIGGLVIGLALALGVDALDRRVRDTDEFQEIYDQPILGSIPRSKGIANQGADVGSLSASDLEAFRILRANLRYVQGAKGAKRIMVSSSTSGEGKSTVAWNLAVTAARGGSRVLLIEADLRQPQITRRYLPSVATAGLSHVLSGQATAGQALVDCTNWIGADPMGDDLGQFSVMLAGDTPPNPAELLASQEMVDLLDHLEARFDLIIVDAPPPALVADPIPLFEIVDGVLVVGRIDYSERRALAEHRERLDAVGARVLGLAINGTHADSKHGYY